MLFNNEISVGMYHGGMNKEERQKMLHSWLKNEVRVMVATNAFGMGIDKPDVRYVAHYEFPNSLEAYFQEAGRGGRDQQTAHAINYWQQEDVDTLEKQFQSKYPPIEDIKHVYRALCNHLKIAIGSGAGETYNFDIPFFSKTFNISPILCYNSLKILESMGEVVFSEGVFHPTKIKFSVSNTALYNFQVQNESYYPITSLLTRSYPGIFNNFMELHDTEFCKRLKITQKELESQLKYMEKSGIIDIDWKSDAPTITFLRQRMPYDYLEIRPEVYHNRKEVAHNKLEKVIDYLTGANCRSFQLIDYFGIASDKCGKCDNCLKESTNQESVDIQQTILNVLKEHPKTNYELKAFFPDPNQFKDAVRSLMLTEKIQFDGEYYSIK